MEGEQIVATGAVGVNRRMAAEWPPISLLTNGRLRSSICLDVRPD